MPLSFTCPHCGHQSNVADQYAGQTGPCAGCGKTITIPSSPEAALSGMAPAVAVAPSRGRGTNVVLVIVAVVGLAFAAVCAIGILLALLLPAVQAAREAARRSQCANNMKQITLAMLNYNEVYGTFPPAYLADENGRPMHSWRVLLLPFMEQEDLYEQYNFDEPWDGPSNSLLAAQIPAVYRCPSAMLAADETHYVVVDGPGYIFEGDGACEIEDIVDGTSNTILIVEAPDNSVNWMQPVDAHWTGSVHDLGMAHPGIIQTAFADGSVMAMNVNIDTTVFDALLTIDGGEDVSPRP